jgi:hypothetical protein
VNAEFNWWLLIVGLVIGAGLVWLILADSARRDADVSDRERASEARWIAEALHDQGRRVSAADVLEVLDLHRSYLGAPPPDEPEDEAEPVIEPVTQPEPFFRTAGSGDPEPLRTSYDATSAPRPAMAHPATDAPRTAATGSPDEVAGREELSRSP